MSRFADIVFARPLIQSYTYFVPETFPPLEIGSRVLAPLGRQTAAGFVVRLSDEPPAGDVSLKALVSVLEQASAVPPALFSFTRRLAAYHVSAWGEMLAAALPPAEIGEPKRKARVQKTLSEPLSPPSQLALDFAATPAVEKAFSAVAAFLEARKFAPFYVYGGAEARRALYQRAVKAVLAHSRKVLILVPEIDEVASVRDWAAVKAGRPAVAVHAQLSPRARRSAWVSIQNGSIPVVIGSRAALFWSIPDLGLIIVDDEPHDAYLQTDSPAFDVRRGAWFRASEEGAVVIFGSDIPSIEAITQAREGGYLFEIGGEAGRRRVIIADDGSSRSLLAPALAEELRRTLNRRGRAILFLNRRGYASLIFCPGCGFVPSCSKCGSRPAYHKREDRLVCHACGTTAPRPSACPRCGRRVLEPRGIGIEALEEEVPRLFPRARVGRLDSDLAGRVSARAKILERYGEGKIDILVGTELLARQAGVPEADFVGIVNPEAWLAFPDFSASARAFQAVSRMLRFARSEGEGGIVVVQTGFPDHPSIRQAGRQDYGAFYAAEIETRRIMNYPPFSSMAVAALSGRDPRSLGRRARALTERIGRAGTGLEMIGPAMVSAPGGRGVKSVEIVLRADNPDAITAALSEGIRELAAGWRVSRWGA